jgi:very-short-patch-repair endonuclease
MDSKNAPPPTDRRVATLAARQHGVITRMQLSDLGLGAGAIAMRARGGRLHRVHRGVYAVGHPLLTRHGRFMAAILACGEGAALSHTSAAVIWRLLKKEEARVHVTVPIHNGRERRRGIVVHRAGLEENEVAVLDRIPVTRPGRTLIDLADLVPRRTLERALDESEYLRLDCSGLAPRPGRRGSGLLTRVLSEHHVGATRTRSELEERFLLTCRRHRLPQPDVNSIVEGYEVDFVWRRERLIVETDGHAAHGTRRAFERDRLRDAELAAAGWRVVRVTHERLGREPAAVAGQLRSILRLAAA